MAEHCITFLDANDEEVFHIHAEAPTGMPMMAVEEAALAALREHVALTGAVHVAVMFLAPVTAQLLDAAAAAHQNGAPPAAAAPAPGCTGLH